MELDVFGQAAKCILGMVISSIFQNFLPKIGQILN